MTAAYAVASGPSMVPKRSSKAWDFSDALALINTLSSPSPASKTNGTIYHEESALGKTTIGNKAESKSLGDFARVWGFLGNVEAIVPPPLSPSAVKNDSTTSEVDRVPDKPNLNSVEGDQARGYASDGATYSIPPMTVKSVKWQNEVESDSKEEDSKAELPSLEVSTPTTLSKRQRKKEKKRLARLEKEKAKFVRNFDSETESKKQHDAPARKASTHSILPQVVSVKDEPQHRYNLRSKSISAIPTSTVKGKKNASKPTIIDGPKKDLEKVSQQTEASSPPKSVSAKLIQQKPSKKKTSTVVADSPSAPSTPTKNMKSSTPAKSINSSTPAKLNGQAHESNTHKPPTSLTPSHVPPPSQTKQKMVQNSVPNPVASLSSHVSAPVHTQGLPVRKAPTKLGPLTVRNGADRHYHLLLKLIFNFGEDLASLVSPVQLVNHAASPQGIHVFVDFSNIWIGFNDSLKRAQGIPVQYRTEFQDISFDAFVLLVERRRPVAKRVLAGSLPSLPAFEMASVVGYETNILDKVYKARELTERQKFFKNSFPGTRRRYPGNENSGNSGSEITGAVGTKELAPPKWVEQGVDEILHLKILESVVDVDKPTTMVLATGDAAEAEYSQGFLRMVERALKKGWKVELVGWRHNISAAYNKSAFRQQWGEQFRIIELDDYLEDLINT
ncbi:hypothetical protein M501DRAFT_334359 [Patellaria atrata CBS 101060]|uniref:NYN domain-containing protein n=1 Tax=Patellaria atrata CBS 101060 TaxID=1346257 RepID=A0A9P4S3W9_9PEZI|nr:hypothetical protein M501DRAFT_334359 [Patellaria atrata CBS 101060]